MSLNFANTSENVCVQMISAYKSHVAAWITFYTHTYTYMPHPELNLYLGKRLLEFSFDVRARKDLCYSGP